MTLLLPSPTTRRPYFKATRFQSMALQPYQREGFEFPLLASAATSGGGEWESHLCFEGVETGDGREIAPGALSMRPGDTLPMMGLEQRTVGHMLARVGGAIQHAERRDETIYGYGRWLSTDFGQSLEGLTTPDENGVTGLHWVSVDLEVFDYEYVVKGVDEDGYDEYLMRITKANLMGATTLPFPAFSRAYIAPKGAGRLEQLVAMGSEDRPLGSVNPYAGPLTIAASGERADHPSIDNFTDPGFTGVTHVRVHEPVNGWRRFSGHLADWSVPHISIGGGTVYAPHSANGYRDFMTKPFTVMGQDGPTEIKVGVISVGCGHAPLHKADGTHYGWRMAGEHYDNPLFQGAIVVMGEDRFGPWISGVVREEATTLQVKLLSHSDVSGDWRLIGRDLELVGIAAVNTAGFPTREAVAASAFDVDFRAAFTASAECPDGEMVALVAAGMIRQDPTEQTLQQVKRRVAALEEEHAALAASLEPFRGLAMEYLAGRVGA